MSMSTNGGQAASPPPTSLPQLNVLAQYIKDFSFENPNAPRILSTTAQPQINIQINVQANPVNLPAGPAGQAAPTGASDFEVELKLEGKAEATGSIMFSFDLTFAGVFRLQNIPQPQMHAVVLIECPRLLFPFAREIVATAVRNGGFPPLLLDPIDFVQLYQQRAAQAGTPAASPTTAA